MSSAFLSDLAQLSPGMACFILEIDTSIPRIWKVWWGTTGRVEKSYPPEVFYLEATIDARVGFYYDGFAKLTRTVTEGSNPQTLSGGIALPVTDSTRKLILELLQAQEQLSEVSGRAMFWEKLFHETFRGVSGGLGPRIAAEFTKVFNS